MYPLAVVSSLVPPRGVCVSLLCTLSFAAVGLPLDFILSGLQANSLSTHLVLQPPNPLGDPCAELAPV